MTSTIRAGGTERHRILVIGNASNAHDLGAMLARAAEEAGVNGGSVNSSFDSYAPSMRTLAGKVFFRLNAKRPLEWGAFNKKAVSMIFSLNPELVVVTGIIPIGNEVFKAARKTGACLVNYLTDSPWSRQNASRAFRRQMPRYGIIASTKTQLCPFIRSAGVCDVRFLPFAYDPLNHRPPEDAAVYGSSESEFPDVCLIGGADADRVRFVNDFLQIYRGSFGLYGGFWERYKSTRDIARGGITNGRFRSAVAGCKINLGVVRRANLDGHSMRSFEIPACGGFGIYEDTAEHRDIFAGYPEQGFFSGPEDLARKCNLLLSDPAKREEMRQLGMRLVRHEGNTYAARLRTMIEWAKK